MDYAMPRADRPAVLHHRTERGAVDRRIRSASARPAKAAPRRRSRVVINAIVDALAEFGVRHIEMPATPENVWRAINAARP